VRSILTCSAVIILALTLVGCGGSSDRAASTPPTPGVHSEGGSMAPFYGEVFHENRFYLFGTKPEFAKFTAQSEKKEANPLKSKMMIGKGPKRETIVVETSKDVPGMSDRLVAQFRTRYGIEAPAATAAP